MHARHSDPWLLWFFWQSLGDHGYCRFIIGKQLFRIDTVVQVAIFHGTICHSRVLHWSVLQWSVASQPCSQCGAHFNPIASQGLRLPPTPSAVVSSHLRASLQCRYLPPPPAALAPSLVGLTKPLGGHPAPPRQLVARGARQQFTANPLEP